MCLSNVNHLLDYIYILTGMKTSHFTLIHFTFYTSKTNIYIALSNAFTSKPNPQINTSPDRQLYGNVNYSAPSGQDGVIVAGLAQWHAPGGRLWNYVP